MIFIRSADIDQQAKNGISAKLFSCVLLITNYGWLNEELVASREYPLKKLNLDTGSIRRHKLYLAVREAENIGSEFQY